MYIVKRSVPSWQANSLLMQVEQLLIHLGIPPTLAGYRYLVCAIIKVINEPECIRYITKEIYPAVARMCGTNASQAERNMRTAILHCWRKTKCEALSEMTGYHLTGRPTNSEFIALSAEHIRYKAMDLRED